MRGVFISIIALACVSGCATVSMVPGEATVETGIAVEQSSLREVSNAYIKQAKSEKWIEDTGGIWGLARVLMDGASKSDQSEASNYVEHVKSETSSSMEKLSRISADIGAAQRGLNVVVIEAEALLGADVDAKSLRTDVFSFESALVTAQQSRRNFAKAIDASSLGGMQVAADAETALAAFDSSLDAAKIVADKLADARLEKDAEATS